ncbi:hypothetical protein H112_02405 [Trichophyton rubrum D6]|uniref:Uncharacterized protein n=2 Tax=Trichophyton TaxID=5550 RepID=A0A022W967_TRIRU|nr:hypothetical protein H100_02406 [Trichophyton rubrum MR850]EZF44273.1 hypothetical protein H102_02403 [Trichophyton rubrum CBS 100081]EZF54912.1 hypothetical protein H103_02415 [Trichophyton rubrum CBS 288.86]EZF65545.1 hypothetical protein H104_02390 [Trichophyton rubrum CBS 289.86]EZF76172.1 hypothetical protein H105_02424 [Trichophyton soudanense CBS 452.61]EZF86822.1 hypothetical protein H110_02409 [Trichophyton rubrum MR1448]EZF97613.1 hypothetical protein H113_02419 [Trichophyton rub
MVWPVEQVLGKSSICVLLLRFDYFFPFARYLMTRMGTSCTWARSQLGTCWISSAYMVCGAFFIWERMTPLWLQRSH